MLLNHIKIYTSATKNDVKNKLSLSLHTRDKSFPNGNKFNNLSSLLQLK